MRGTYKLKGKGSQFRFYITVLYYNIMQFYKIILRFQITLKNIKSNQTRGSQTENIDVSNQKYVKSLNKTSMQNGYPLKLANR